MNAIYNFRLMMWAKEKWESKGFWQRAEWCAAEADYWWGKVPPSEWENCV